MIQAGVDVKGGSRVALVTPPDKYLATHVAAPHQNNNKGNTHYFSERDRRMDMALVPPPRNIQLPPHDHPNQKILQAPLDPG